MPSSRHFLRKEPPDTVLIFLSSFRGGCPTNSVPVPRKWYSVFLALATRLGPVCTARTGIPRTLSELHLLWNHGVRIEAGNARVAVDAVNKAVNARMYPLLVDMASTIFLSRHACRIFIGPCAASSVAAVPQPHGPDRRIPSGLCVVAEYLVGSTGGLGGCS